MPKIFLFVAILFSYSLLSAQFSDDFSDGDFTQNPTWSGDVNEFKISSSNQLQLDGSGSDTSVLVVSNASIVNTEWSFFIKQSFNSSSNNHTRIYLASDQQDLKGSLNGYYVQFGSSDDDIVLYRQDGSTSTALISSTSGMTGNSTNPYTLKITRDLNGLWELYADPNQGSNYQLIDSVTDQTYSTTSFFGVWCKYTSSNATKVYFDDFLVQSVQVDTFPPQLQSVKIISPTQLDVYFSESLDSASASDAQNYQLNNGLGKPQNAQLDAAQSSLVHLSFSQAMNLGTSYTLSVDHVEDLKGNAMSLEQISFDYYLAQFGDVVFNEIMADPTPVIALPDQEYLELYNQSAYDISLGGWTLSIGTKDYILPDTLIRSGEYLIVCHEDFTLIYEAYGKVLPLSSLSLVNGGQEMILLDENLGLIHHISYSDTWYGQSSKSEGGWSLEQIDPSNFCGGSSNWWASNDAIGGTPGKQNSIFASKPDQMAPQVSRVAVVDSLHINVVFTESMDSSFLFQIANYSINENIGNPLSVQSNFPNYNQVTLSLGTPLQQSIIYKLQISDTLKDCVGNPMLLNTTVRFGMAQKPEKFDLVINEMLFDPKDDGVDYVEIYNRSDKILEISGMKLANYDEFVMDFENLSLISEEPFAIFPGEYWVLTTSSSIVRNQYLCKNPNNFVEMIDFPSMNNSDGNVYLITSAMEVIDSIHYTDEMHFALLKSVDGVSLERIYYEAQGSDNWHSASESSGFGTPTYQNSQFRTSAIPSGTFSVDPEIFSPDNDGFDDVVSIHYELPQGSVLSSVVVYDAAGRLIRRLASNAITGASGKVIWDGIDEQGNKAPIGVYIVFVETLSTDGNVQSEKLMLTLATKF